MEVWPVSFLTWFLVIVGIIFSYIIHINNKLKYWKHQGIPSPVNGVFSFVKGTYMFMNKPLYLMQIEFYEKYGRVHGGFMGLKPQLSLAEPQILKKILVKDFNMFHNRMKFRSGNKMVDNMLSVLEDEDWKRIRCIMSPTFTSSRMRKMAYLVKECAEKFSENLKKIVDENENQAIDCKKYLSNFSIDVIASTAFGTKVCSLDDPKNEFVNKLRQITNTNASYIWLLMLLFPSVRKLMKFDAFSGVFNYFRDFILHVIEKREKEKTKSSDFLQLLLDAQKGVLEISPEDIKEEQKEQSDFKLLPKHKTMSSDEMMAQSILFMFAGSETTTNTLAFVIYYLALHPEYEDKLIKEVDETWKNNTDMNFDVLNKMQYLEAFISETLRKEPVGLQLMRECTEDYELTDIGFKIPKGMNVIIPVYGMHHDKEFFPDPEKFDPERFMPENRSSIPAYVYLPFGDGPRNCIGMRFALMVLKMCIVHILRDFRAYATEETKKPLEFFVGQGLLQPKKIMVKLEKRE